MDSVDCFESRARLARLHAENPDSADESDIFGPLIASACFRAGNRKQAGVVFASRRTIVDIRPVPQSCRFSLSGMACTE
jgi:hypothetical protein